MFPYQFMICCANSWKKLMIWKIRKKMAFVHKHPICEKVKRRLPAASVACNVRRVLWCAAIGAKMGWKGRPIQGAQHRTINENRYLAIPPEKKITEKHLRLLE